MESKAEFNHVTSSILQYFVSNNCCFTERHNVALIQNVLVVKKQFVFIKLCLSICFPVFAADKRIIKVFAQYFFYRIYKKFTLMKDMLTLYYIVKCYQMIHSSWNPNQNGYTSAALLDFCGNLWSEKCMNIVQNQ